MTIHAHCPRCKVELEIPNDLAGQRSHCPNCSKRFLIPVPTTADRRITADPEGEDEVVAKPVPRQAPQPGPDEEDEAEPAADVEADEEEELPKKKRKKKSKRPRPDDEGMGVPDWAWWWAGAFATLAVVVAFGIAIAMRKDTVGPVFFLVVNVVILVPVGFVVLIISFLLASMLAGGIDFGPVNTAVPKALILLLMSSFIEMFGLPFFVDSGILFILWLIGLMVLYHLDVWESWFVIIMNWVLLKAAFFAVLMLVLATATGGGKAFQGPDDDLQRGPIPMREHLDPGGGGEDDGGQK
jgi:hypothetical protein